jgi:hypothetical protein
MSNQKLNPELDMSENSDRKVIKQYCVVENHSMHPDDLV